MPRDLDRELKLQNNSREFLRNETLAGYCQNKYIPVVVIEGRGSTSRHTIKFSHSLSSEWGVGLLWKRGLIGGSGFSGGE